MILQTTFYARCTGMKFFREVILSCGDINNLITIQENLNNDFIYSRRSIFILSPNKLQRVQRHNLNLKKQYVFGLY